MTWDESVRRARDDLKELRERAFHACCDSEGRTREERRTWWHLMIKCMDANRHLYPKFPNGGKRYERDIEEIHNLVQRIKEQEEKE